MKGMKGKAGATETHHLLTEDQLMELTNLTIEMDALVRIFEHASCDNATRALLPKLSDRCIVTSLPC
jgi:hypothetical protein